MVIVIQKILKQTFKPEMFTDFPIINKAFSMLESHMFGWTKALMAMIALA